MTVIATALKHLIAAGVTGDALVTAVAEMEQAIKPSRSTGAERTARWRAKKAEGVTVTSQASPVVTCDNKKETSPTPPKEKTTTNNPTIARDVRGTRLPGDFVPSAEVLQVARDLGLSDDQIKFEVADFTDYWRGVPGAKGRKLDWQATLRNRFRDVHRRKRPQHQRSSPAQAITDAFDDLDRHIAGRRAQAGHG